MKNKNQHIITMPVLLRMLTILLIVGLMVSCSSDAGHKEMIPTEDVASESYEPTPRESEAAAEEAVEEDYESDEYIALPASRVSAFEQMAVQKLQDFADLLYIATDASLEEEFRAQAENMILDIFKQEGTMLMINANSGAIHNITLESLFTESSKAIEFELSNIRMHTPLTTNTSNQYSGSIASSLRVLQTEPNNTFTEGEYTLTVEVHLAEYEKNFGDESKMVWEVSLGNMELVGR